MELIAEVENVLQERTLEIGHHKELLCQLASIKEKVRQQRMQVDMQWQTLYDVERKEVEVLEGEKEAVETSLKNEALHGSKESIASKPSSQETSKTSKYPPSKLGNYHIIAKRLQTEIKQLDQHVNEMKVRLQQELQYRNNLDSKVRELRSTLATHKGGATTPVQ